MERYRFIHAEEAHFSVVPMCRLLGVSRSGYYGWRERGDSDRNARTASFDAEVRAAHLKSQMRYGSRRVQCELHENGLGCSRTRLACAMRRCGLVARARRLFKATTDSNHQLEVAPNLLSRAFHASRPNKAWVGDITYLWTRQGWLYLAILIDLHARRVVGWAMSEQIDRHLVLGALRMAIGMRRPKAGLLHHTDRGSQYASRDYRQALQAAGIVCSMSRKGNCWDNAPAESFFATLKVEELRHFEFNTRDEARDKVLQYICWYNAHRRHSTLGLLSPATFEAQTRTATCAA